MSDFWQYGYWKENPKTGKMRFISLGYAKQRHDGGFFIEQDATAPGESLVIQPPRERNVGGYTPGPRQATAERPMPQVGGGQLEDDIPWAPEWRG